MIKSSGFRNRRVLGRSSSGLVRGSYGQVWRDGRIVMQKDYNAVNQYLRERAGRYIISISRNH